MTPAAIAGALRARGTELAPGRANFHAGSLATLGFAAVHADLVALVRCFDGFVGMDERHIHMWDVATILEENVGDPPPAGLLAIGDFLIFSDVILCDPCDAGRPLVYRFEGRELAPSYAAFWARMAAGDMQ